MSPFEQFQKEFSKNKNERKKIIYKRGLKYLITKDRINFLFDDYFEFMFQSEDSITFYYRDQDLALLLFIFRCHFKIWIEIDDYLNFIKVYKNFPSNFILTKEVNKDNHWFAEETIPVGTILYLAIDNYRMVNWLNGIPLSNFKREGNNILYFQINYDYIKRFDLL